MISFVFSNQKGGVGKTALAVHKAFIHAEREEKVLFIDFDAQGNSTSTLKNRSRTVFTAAELFYDEPLNIEAAPGITLIEGTDALSEIDRLNNKVVLNPKNHLKDFLSRFDVCIMDTPPALGLRLIAALIIADYVICPIELSGYSIAGIKKMIQTINGVKSNLNPNLKLLGILPNLVDSRAGLHKKNITELYRHFGDKIINQPLVRRISIQDAVDNRKPVWEIKTGAARVAAKEMRAAMASIDALAKQSARITT